MADPAATPVDALVPAMTLLAAGGAAALFSKALKISPIVGYLAAGVVIGPSVFGWMGESATTHLLAELGVVFLLFDIGMHISLREMKESGRDLIGLAPAHLVLTATPFTIALGLFGLPWPVAIAIGISLGLSSTAVVSRIMAERGLGACPLGRSATHILIFQDIVAIFLLIFANSLGGDAANLLFTMGRAALFAVVAFAIAVVAGRFLMGPLFKVLVATRNHEAFTAVTLLLVLGAASVTAVLGLSLTLGAFLAGLAVSGTAFRHQIQVETGPFRGLLLGFFFMSVGLSVDVMMVASYWPYILAIAMTILVAKSLFGFVAGWLNGWTLPGRVQLSFLLAQGSEFTLVVLSILVVTTDAIAPIYETLMVTSVALTLAIAPFWAAGGMSLSRKLARRLASNEDLPSRPAQPGHDRPVVIFGMTQAGRIAADALRDHEIGFVAFDADPQRFMSAIADGYIVSFGDAANRRLIEAAGAGNARAVVIGAPRYDVSRDLTPAVQRDFPGLTRFVSVETEEDRARFAALGMRAWMSAGETKGLEMAADLLRHLGIEESRIADWLSRELDRLDLDEASVPQLTPVEEAA